SARRRAETYRSWSTTRRSWSSTPADLEGHAAGARRHPRRCAGGGFTPPRPVSSRTSRRDGPPVRLCGRLLEWRRPPQQEESIHLETRMLRTITRSLTLAAGAFLFPFVLQGQSSPAGSPGVG